MDKNNGGPAFPDPGRAQSQKQREALGNEGMTLRDYFAASVDIPWNAVIETLKLKGEPNPTVMRTVEYRAAMRYAEADAMLRAREQ